MQATTLLLDSPAMLLHPALALRRRHGAAVTRIRVTSDFKAFFDASPAGVYNGTESEDADPFFFWHAIVLIGESCWPARVSAHNQRPSTSPMPLMCTAAAAPALPCRLQ